MPGASHHAPARRRPKSASTKRRLADAVEAAAASSAEAASKRDALVEAVYAHAKMLASERAAVLPGSVHDDLVSEMGERTTVALSRLDLEAPPAQQVAYLDSQLRHALADACRAVDPLGRGPRALRKRFESVWEEAAQRWGREPDHADREAMLDDLVGSGASPVLRTIVGHADSPTAGLVAHLGPGHPGADPAEAASAAMGRAEVASVVAAHPDTEIRDYLAKVAMGAAARKPSNFHRRLGPTLPQVLSAWRARAEDCDGGAEAAVLSA